MIEVEKRDFGKFTTLFENYGPNQPVIDAVLAGFNPGKLWIDDEDPCKNAVLITQYGFTFGWGEKLASLIHKQATEMGKTLTFVPSPSWSEAVGLSVKRLEFLGPNDMEVLESLSWKPENLNFVDINSQNFMKSNWKHVILELFSNAAMFERSGGGIALTDGNVFVAEALIGFVGHRHVEIGTVTHSEHRGKGYSTIVCAELIKRLQAQGLSAYWSCNAENLGSKKVAERLNFQEFRPYTVYWVKPKSNMGT